MACTGGWCGSRSGTRFLRAKSGGKRSPRLGRLWHTLTNAGSDLQAAQATAHGSERKVCTPAGTSRRHRLHWTTNSLPTQKPLALLNDHQASSNENDIILDAFCAVAPLSSRAELNGSGSASTSLQQLAVMAKRLQDICRIREDEKLWRVVALRCP